MAIDKEQAHKAITKTIADSDKVYGNDKIYAFGYLSASVAAALEMMTPEERAKFFPLFDRELKG